MIRRRSRHGDTTARLAAVADPSVGPPHAVCKSHQTLDRSVRPLAAQKHLPVCLKCMHAVSPDTGYKTARFPACHEAALGACAEDEHSFCDEMQRAGSSEEDDYLLWIKVRDWLDRHCDEPRYRPTKEELQADAEYLASLGKEMPSMAEEVEAIPGSAAAAGADVDAEQPALSDEVGDESVAEVESDELTDAELSAAANQFHEADGDNDPVETVKTDEGGGERDGAAEKEGEELEEDEY